jgi:chemotaxis protein MotB
MSGGGGGHGKKGAKHEEHEEHEEHVNHEAWVIPYADMLTLLMALFLVLFAIGRTDLEKFKKLAESFRSQFGNGDSAQVISIGGGTGDSPLDGGTGVLSEDGANADTPVEVKAALAEYVKKQAEDAKEGLQDVEDAIAQQAGQANLADKLAFRFEGRGLVLSLVNDGVLFKAGDATLQPGGMEVLQLVMSSLQDIPNNLSIEGHTDSRPISNNRFASNWELSTTRATSVLRYMEEQGFAKGRLSASGYGDTRPVAGNDTAEGQAQNRRVEIVIESDIPLGPALDGEVVPTG